MSQITDSMARILVVDDDELMRQTLSQFLESKGYAVETAENGQEALEKLGAGLTCSAILLDLHMPVLDGMEALATIKGDRPDLPVIVLTAKKESDLIREARALGAFDYIVKPPDLGRVEILLSACCLSPDSEPSITQA